MFESSESPVLTPVVENVPEKKSCSRVKKSTPRSTRRGRLTTRSGRRYQEQGEGSGQRRKSHLHELSTTKGWRESEVESSNQPSRENPKYKPLMTKVVRPAGRGGTIRKNHLSGKKEFSS